MATHLITSTPQGSIWTEIVSTRNIEYLLNRHNVEEVFAAAHRLNNRLLRLQTEGKTVCCTVDQQQPTGSLEEVIEAITPDRLGGRDNPTVVWDTATQTITYIRRAKRGITITTTTKKEQ